jgi:hypothetical protein
MPFQSQKQLISQKVGLSLENFCFFMTFFDGSGPNLVPAELEPDPEPKPLLHSGSDYGSDKAKSYGSCGSGSGSTTCFTVPVQ